MVAALGEVTFFALLPPLDPGPGLPTCPDGSGDPWWDDASYLKYQAWDPSDEIEYSITTAHTATYCDGPNTYGPMCAHHTAETASTDCPF